MSEQKLDPSERRDLLTALDRLEERLETAVPGLHATGTRPDPQALKDVGLPEGAALLWARYDGVELMSGEARLLPLCEIAQATDDAREEGLLRDGDIVVGERGRLLFALPADPWAEGASIVSISEEAERIPEATSAVHLMLGILGEVSVLYDEHGEFHDALIDEWGELEPAAHRKLLRRRLDFDPFAPGPRLQLAQLLRKAEEFRAASKEVDKVLHYAPEFPAAHFERGLVLRALDKHEPARRAFAKAAEYAVDRVNAAGFEAWAARVAREAFASNEDAKAEKAADEHAAKTLRHRPDYAQNQFVGAKARLERRDREAAAELVALGLAVAPRHLELLQLRRELDEA